MSVKERVNQAVRTRVLAARRGERVEAMTERRQRMATMRSRRQRGQLRGSSALSEGWGTRMMPFCFLTGARWIATAAGWVRSERVAVPVWMVCWG